MRHIILLIAIVTTIFSQEPIIKIDGQELLKALAYTPNSPYVKLYDWKIGADGMSPVIWDKNGNNWTPAGFERQGKVYITNNGRITHNIVDNEKSLGFWNLWMLGSKDKIIKVKLTPNQATLENPSILIDKSYIKEQVVCEENNTYQKSVYNVGFPRKLPFWMIEEKSKSDTKGGMSIYTITFDKKPSCAKSSSNAKSANSTKIDSSTKEQIGLFLKSFYKSGENSFPAKALKFYASNVTQYFAKRDVSKEQILEDKIRYYKKFPTRHYTLKDFEIIDTKVSNGIRSYEVNTAIDWNVTSAKGKTKTGSSYGLLTLIETDNGFLVKAVRSIGERGSISEGSDNSYNKLSSYNTYAQNKNLRKDTKYKKIEFKDNGIKITIIYPTVVKAGSYFNLKAKMTNNSANAKQGGLTLSFPDMNSIRGKIVGTNFRSLKGYSYPDKIYNKNTHSTMRTKYFMVEGWQDRRWYRGETKYFSVKLKAPSSLNRLRVNARGVLWIRNSRDTRLNPAFSDVFDQQGFAVEQFAINIQ